MNSNELLNDEYAPFYAPYLSTLDNVSLLDELEISVHEFIRFVREIPLGKHDYRYAEGKWTIKDIIQHLIDAERIFSYRALRIARKDRTPLPGFEENEYAENTDANGRTLQDILTELAVVRQSTISLFKSFTDEQLKNRGIASNNEISARAIGFIIIGHMKHHQRIYFERYL